VAPLAYVLPEALVKKKRSQLCCNWVFSSLLLLFLTSLSDFVLLFHI
jgi:hypothetical protein